MNVAWNSTNMDEPILSIPLNFTRSGYYRDGELGAFLSSGLFWQGEAYYSGAWYLDFHDEYLDPLRTREKGVGFTIRCLVR